MNDTSIIIHSWNSSFLQKRKMHFIEIFANYYDVVNNSNSSIFDVYSMIVINLPTNLFHFVTEMLKAAKAWSIWEGRTSKLIQDPWEKVHFLYDTSFSPKHKLSITKYSIQFI